MNGSLVSESETYVLRMESIEKTFGGVRALRGATVKVKRGTVHGLVGENGAGKSTLLKILDGQYPHGSYGGTVYLEDRALELHSPQDARAMGIAIVPQETHVIDSLTVGENICLGGHSKRTVSVREFQRSAGEFLEARGIPLDPRDQIRSLSASQRQLVMIARALYQNPSLLILDEPTSALTKEESDRLFDLLHRLRDQGLTSVFVSHRIDEVMSLCDHVTVMRDGLTVAEIDKGEMEPNLIIRSMIGRDLEALYPERPVAESRHPVLEVRDLVVRNPTRRQVLSVKGVSFDLHEGEILGIGGLVGSGRSEVLRALYGDLPFAGGSATFDGEPFSAKSPRDALRQGIGFLTEDRKKEGLLFNMGVRSNLTLADIARYGGVLLNSKKETSTTKEQLQAFGVVAASTESPIGTLSGGNQQKVLLARSLQRKPKVLLLDEPTVGVDVGAKKEIYELIARLADEGVAIVLVSSEAGELLGLCDRVLVLKNGEIVDEFARAEASEHRLMSAAMIGATSND
jgi:ABC-type sugar transport system ATPase subunit